MYKKVCDKYSIDENGMSKNDITGKLLKQKKNKRGYIFYTIYADGKRKDISAHREVARLFIPNPQNLPQVNHIDGDKTNNNVLNLEWISASGNLKHAVKYYGHGFKAITIEMYKNGNLVDRFNSMVACANYFGVNSGMITKCCNNNKSYKGYTFKKIGNTIKIGA